MRRIVGLITATCLCFGFIALLGHDTSSTSGGTAHAEKATTPLLGEAQSKESIKALKAYVAAHPSLAKSHNNQKMAQATQSASKSATANGWGVPKITKRVQAKPQTKVRINRAGASYLGAKTGAENKGAAQTGAAPALAPTQLAQSTGKRSSWHVPTQAEKAKRGQADELLVPIGKAKRPGKPGAPGSLYDPNSTAKKPASASNGAASEESETASAADEDHLKLFVENRYPSANTCGVCHPKHYKEWSVSQHAYAQLSPVYLTLSNRINQLSNGSNGDFCLRCHSPVGANLGESPFMSNLDRHPTSREGITCVVCHRINRAYNKASGRLALVEGGLTSPVFGPAGNKGTKDVLDRPDKFRVVTKEKEPGRKIHSEAKLFDSIKTPVFCGTCHDVTLFNGFRLEEAYSEYRVSPAAAKGITCQDCHMGKIQGVPSGYEHGPAAIVGDVPTASRKLTSHLFSGPDSSIVHPGIFPHNQKAAAFKTLREWLQFKHEKGWGTDKFENDVPPGYKFPKPWRSIDDRYDAREILNEQFKLLEYARLKRVEVLRNGYIMDNVEVSRADEGGLSFRVRVRNGTDGHNVPTGFTGERLVWLDVTVKDRNGTVVLRSGDRDPNGDLRDGHSYYVKAGKISLDSQLFSLQSIFVTQNGRGGEIEHVIPIPYPTFALPRVLPSTTSLVFTGEPATERNHKKGIEPNGIRWASYSVGSSALTGQGPYELDVKLIAQSAPANLIIASQNVGFDYGMTPAEVGRRIIRDSEVLWRKKLILRAGLSDTGRSSLGAAKPAHGVGGAWRVKVKGATNGQ